MIRKISDYILGSSWGWTSMLRILPSEMWHPVVWYTGSYTVEEHCVFIFRHVAICFSKILLTADKMKCHNIIEHFNLKYWFLCSIFKMGEFWLSVVVMAYNESCELNWCISFLVLWSLDCLAQDMIMQFCLPEKLRNCVSSWAPLTFPVIALFHEVVTLTGRSQVLRGV